ncbi:MAG: FGGY family carbohydrate kinase [Pirellulales bacterium]
MANSRTTCVLSLDQGTTSSRAILFDRRGGLLAVAQEEFPQHARAVAGPDGGDLGIVEHDPEDIWRTQLSCARRVLATAGVTAAAVDAIGITNQRETTILESIGRPVPTVKPGDLGPRQAAENQVDHPARGGLENLGGRHGPHFPCDSHIRSGR